MAGTLWLVVGLLVALASIFLSPFSYFRSSSQADVTLVLLNWSRFPNVQRIVNGYCHHLSDTVESVIVWNNNPNQTVLLDDFQCSPDKLKIVNSPKNDYFKARHTACSQATTSYCFYQDDDFLLDPGVVRAMRRSMTPSSYGIFLSPPEEALKTHLRTLLSQDGLHTSFVWFGYGSLVPRSLVLEFLELVDTLDMPEDEAHMADNYFAILRNELPQVWTVTEPVLKEIGGGQAFTVGDVGEQRNNKHILKAAEYLVQILSKDEVSSPFVSTAVNPIDGPPVHRAPCMGKNLLLEATFSLFETNTDVDGPSATDIFKLERERHEKLDAPTKEAWLSHPLSRACDGDPETFFQSPTAPQEGDTLSFLPYVGKSEGVELEVDSASAVILRESQVEISHEGRVWIGVGQGALQCRSGESGREKCSVQTHSVPRSRIRITKDWAQEMIKIYEIN